MARTTVTGSVAAIMVIGAMIAGCGGDNDSSPASSSSASSAAASPSNAQPTDYSGLLVKAGDVGFTTPQPPVLNPNGETGVAQAFTSPDGTEHIGDTILIAADPAIAAAGLENTKANYAAKVNGTWQPADVGSNGAMISGTAPDNSRAIAALVFTEGKALVNIEFDSPPNDPIAPNDALNFGRKQAAAIKAGLPS